jgi:hypothetical protein
MPQLFPRQGRAAHTRQHILSEEVFFNNLLGPRNVDTWKLENRYEPLLLTELLYFLVGRLWGTTLKQAHEKMPTPRRRNCLLIVISCQDEEFFTLKT